MFKVYNCLYLRGGHDSLEWYLEIWKKTKTVQIILCLGKLTAIIIDPVIK